MCVFSIPVLLLWCRQKGLPQPSYSAESKDRLFLGSVTVDGLVYCALPGEKNRRYAEQAAALVWMKHTGITG